MAIILLSFNIYDIQISRGCAKADAVFMFWINCEEVNERITNKIGKRI